MTSAFTEKEKLIIQSALKEAAKHYASTIGIRKTTVDELAESAGISKGAFYKFYETKESLFFEMLEDYHDEFYKAAWETWEAFENLPHPQRAAEVLFEMFRLTEENSLINFIENDLPYVLRKISTDQLKKHQYSDYIYLKDFLEKTGIELKQPFEILPAAIRGLALPIFHKKEIGELYSEVLKIMIQGICEQLIY